MHVGRIARYPVCNPNADVAGILPNPLSVPTVPHAIDAIHAAMAGFTATIVGSTSTLAVTSDAVSTGVSVIWESL